MIVDSGSDILKEPDLTRHVNDRRSYKHQAQLNTANTHQG